MSNPRPIDILLPRLEGVIGKGPQYSARCPAHEDKSPSLRIKESEDGTLLIHCMVGCSPVDVMESLGMSLGDLFVKRLGHYIPGKKRNKISNRENEAVYELAGAANLTQRLRDKDREIAKLKQQLKESIR